MSKALRRFVLPAVALVAVVAGSRAVVAAPAEPAATVSPQATAPVSTGDRAVFVPVTQRRVLSTTSGSVITPSAPRAVKVAGVGTVPAGALAVVVNVAAYRPAKAGYLTVYPTGTTRPWGVSTVNFLVGQITENVATVKVGTGGQITVFASSNAHAIVDVAGYYVGHAHDDRYLPKTAAQARTAPGAFACPDGSLIKSVAPDGAATCVQDATGPVGSVGAGLLLDNGVLSAEQRRGVQNAFTCPPGQYLRVVAADGTPTCAADRDTTYAAGPGLMLSNGVFSAEQGRSAVNAFTCPTGHYLQAVGATGAPTCVLDADTDTDTNTTYEAGFGLLLEGNLFSAEQGRSAKQPFFCESGTYLREVDADGFSTCEEDQTGPTYAPGFGISIDGSTISAQQGRSAAGAFSCPAGQYLRHVAADGTPTCAADAVGPTYAAGSGLALSGTTFSLAEGANVVRVRGDSVTAADNGARLRSTLAALPFVPTATRPILVVLSPGTYDIGTGTNMAVPAYVTLVGSGRDATVITGSFGAGSSGLLELGTGSTLASMAVKNSAGTNAAVAPIVVNGGTARIFDVAGTATGTAAGPTAFGLVVFSGANVVVEQSTFTASGPSSAYALYAVSATLRGINVTGTATSGTGAAYGVAGGSSSTVDLAGGWLTATSTAGGTPYVAGELGASDVVRIAHARLTGGLYGTPTCFGSYDASYAPRTC